MKYWPLISLVVIAGLAATALSSGFEMRSWMHYFMGFFLCQFAMLKIFHPGGFADGFSMYDLIASRWRLYGYIYPLIELGLGLGYLSFFAPVWVYSVTMIVLGIGAIGVVRSLLRGLDLRCACMGTVLDVPLSTVTLTEDVAMIAMAALLLYNM
ncbi:MAG TPA: MauE/DoxX family redox-associated membrane protein [Chlamydiales bacterium]|nr:MauE/DoxX family redox-associated membrane protein [Chlamydiales bacterium]